MTAFALAPNSSTHRPAEDHVEVDPGLQAGGSTIAAVRPGSVVQPFAPDETIRGFILRSLSEAGVRDPAAFLAEQTGAALVRKLETAEARRAGCEPEWQRAMRGAKGVLA